MFGIDDNDGDIDDNMLYDIYNIHKCFKFGNYQFMDYSKQTFIDNVNNNNYFNQNNKNTQFMIKMHDIPEIDLFPQYIIDDDMYEIWRYFFSASHSVHKLIKNKNIIINAVKICVIPNRIISIYDENIIFPYGVNGIDQYLKSKNVIFHQSATKVLSSHSDIATINHIFEAQIKKCNC